MASVLPPYDYHPIGEHGVVGDLRTVALVTTGGCVDWLCLPRFDSPSVFGAILDRHEGGSFCIAPLHEGYQVRQLYLPDTNVLITRFLTPTGVCEIEDFMPISARRRDAGQSLVRRVLCVRGTIPMAMACEPRFDYGRAEHKTNLHDHGAVFESVDLSLALGTETKLARTEYGVEGQFTLEAGESRTFILEVIGEDGQLHHQSEQNALELFDRTVAFWRGWLSQSRYTGRWRETVNRSALTLKLLTYAPTGALVAAPTTSLPEQIGGVRNWDYRYTWIRDAAFSLFALLRLGFTDEAACFMDWLTQRFRDDASLSDGPLQVMYRIDGSTDLVEEVLDHWEGYKGSAPVRIGNGAADQLQLDIYGELIDSVYLYNKHGSPISHETWSDVTRIVDWVCNNWDQADEGIWEVRGGRKDFTYSRLMSWVAVERSVRVANQRGLPADLIRWQSTRDAIYTQIMERGWHPKRGAFVQHYDAEHLDASVLLMPLVKFIAPNDPMWTSTLDAISDELVSDSLVYRYKTGAAPDGLEGEEGTFSICTFWYVEALARAGRLDEARLVFEKMLTYANHLGLYSEEIGPTGEQLGNFPQAFTHLALISAAHTLDERLG
jgi:GH15 family glucan-1,4-alpha-glucosidase